MTNRHIETALINRQFRTLHERKLSGLCHTKFVGVQPACRKLIHIERAIVCAMRIDEMSIFGMVFHTCAHAAPHALIHFRINAIGLWTKRREINVATRLRVLGGKDMVPCGGFVEIRILGVMGFIEQIL